MTRWWPGLYLFVAVPAMLCLALLLPLGEGPDEAAQVARAASLLRFQLIGHRAPAPHPVDGAPMPVAGVDINPGYLLPLLRLPSVPDAPRKSVTLETLQDQYAVLWPVDRGFVAASNTAGYMPLLFGPTAVGLGAARLSGALPAQAVMAGRLMNGLGSLLIGCLALRFAGRRAPALFALLALPMTLHLSAAISQDGPLIALAALAAALLPRESGRAYAAGIVALACVVAAKPAYLPLSAAALLPLDGGTWRLRRHGLGFLAVFVCGLAWAVLAVSMVAVPFWRVPYAPGPLWPSPLGPGEPALVFRGTDLAAQWHVLASQPLLLLTLPLRTVAAEWRGLASSAVGVLASLDLVLPAWLYRVWYGAGALSFAAAMLVARGRGARHDAEVRGPSVWVVLAMLACGLACVQSVFILQYLSWTRVGAPLVEGVQGRYFIPILMLMAAALPGLPVRSFGMVAARRMLALPAALAALLGVAVLPAVLVLRYYLR